MYARRMTSNNPTKIIASIIVPYALGFLTHSLACSVPARARASLSSKAVTCVGVLSARTQVTVASGPADSKPRIARAIRA